MIIFLILMTLIVVAAIAWTVVELGRDGYRRRPTIGPGSRAPVERP
jgi:hypothetical protein